MPAQKNRQHVEPGETWEGQHGEMKRRPSLGGNEGLAYLICLTKARFKRYICPKTTKHLLPLPAQ